MTTTDDPTTRLATTRAEAEQRYRQQFPLMAAYDDIVRECSDPQTSINEPAPVSITTTRATELALDRIGRPARDLDDLRYAGAYIDRLHDELAAAWPETPSIFGFVVSSQFQFAGCVFTADQWADLAEDDRFAEIEEIVASVPPDDLRHILKEALVFAMPAVLREITESDEARRNRPRLIGKDGL